MMHKMMTREMRKVTGGRARVPAVVAVVGSLAIVTPSSADTLASALLLSRSHPSRARDDHPTWPRCRGQSGRQP